MTAVNANDLPEEVLERIGLSKSNGKLTAEANNKVAALGKILQIVGSMSKTDARWVLAEAMSYCRAERDNSDPRTVIQVVAKFFNIPPAEILGRRRNEVVVHARQIVMYLLWLSNRYTLQQIGDALGNRSPATISYGFQTVGRQMSKDPVMADWLKQIAIELDWSLP